MKVSLNWLQMYFSEKIPNAEKIAELFTSHSFEVESIEKISDDFILDIKVLPDRAHYCLSHRGIASELSVIIGKDIKHYPYFLPKLKKTKTQLDIEIKDKKMCRRYIGRVIEGVKVAPSPLWLKKKIETLGGRSICNIVDITNYVMFDLGQPLHAFDADKVKGKIIIRRATDGERITTLDGIEVKLGNDNLIIADEEGPLAIAGVKGGKKAEIDAKTKNIILESANFDPVSVRKTSQKLNIKTDSSKRFENELSPFLADEAMNEATSLVYEIASGEVGKKNDKYSEKAKPWKVKISIKEISLILGVVIPKKEIEKILISLNIKIEKKGENFILTPPVFRLDLKIPEDIAEEVGRIWGYEKIEEKIPIEKGFKPTENLNFIFSNKIKQIFSEMNFSEIYGYSFASSGEVELENSLTKEKSFLRANLSSYLNEKISFNLNHILFEKDPVKLFEVGVVFGKNTEDVHIAFGCGFKNKKFGDGKKEVFSVIEKIFNILGIKETVEKAISEGYLKISSVDNNSIMELKLDFIIKNSKLIPSLDLKTFISKEKKYKKISHYPRVIRDIAIFVPFGTKESDVNLQIKKLAGDWLLEGPILFDVYDKKDEIGKIIKHSFAFRLVFQSHEKTLSDEEVNNVMKKVIEELEKTPGWEARK